MCGMFKGVKEEVQSVLLCTVDVETSRMLPRDVYSRKHFLEALGSKVLRHPLGRRVGLSIALYSCLIFCNTWHSRPEVA